MAESRHLKCWGYPHIPAKGNAASKADKQAKQSVLPATGSVFPRDFVVPERQSHPAAVGVNSGTLSVCTDKLSEIRSPKAVTSRVWGDEGDLIPESAVESIIGELQDLFARHGAGAALSAKAVFKPTKDFHMKWSP